MDKKNIKNDYILMVAAVSLLIFGGGIVLWSSNVKNNNGTFQALPSKIIGAASLTVDFGNGEKRVFEGDIIENETLVGVLMQASKAGNFSYKLDEKNNLAAIDSFIRNKNKSWHWYLNDKEINRSLGEIILKSGDKILIKYAP